MRQVAWNVDLERSDRVPKISRVIDRRPDDLSKADQAYGRAARLRELLERGDQIPNAAGAVSHISERIRDLVLHEGPIDSIELGRQRIVRDPATIGDLVDHLDNLTDRFGDESRIVGDHLDRGVDLVGQSAREGTDRL